MTPQTMSPGKQACFNMETFSCMV